MTVFGERTTKAKRKAARCSWCRERIEVGQPSRSWMWKDGRDVSHVEVHPECADAIDRTSVEERGQFEFDLYGQKRGQSWGEAGYL